MFDSMRPMLCANDWMVRSGMASMAFAEPRLRLVLRVCEFPENCVLEISLGGQLIRRVGCLLLGCGKTSAEKQRLPKP